MLEKDPAHSSIESEAVLLVPQKLTQSAYLALTEEGCVPRRWHLEGRYGSRTHRHEDDDDSRKRMALPILSSFASALTTDSESTATVSPKLQELMATDGVEVVTKPIFRPKNAPRCEGLDATVHPERRPEEKMSDPPLSKFMTNERKNLPSFTFMELFAGIGGFGVALSRLGGTCVFASEIDPACQAVYTANILPKHDTTANENPHKKPKHENDHILRGDICGIPDRSLPRHDLLVGGFPCQPFSNLGSQPGLEDDKKGLLYSQIVRVLKHCQPRAFLLENVPGLLRTHNGKDMQTIMTDLEGAGYIVKVEVVSSRALTAQARKRLFFVGILRDNENVSSVPFSFPFIPDLGLRARDIITYDKSASDTANLNLHLTDKQLQQLISRKWKPGAKLAWPDKVCDTLDSHYGVTVGKGNSQLVPSAAISHPRRFSPRECARLMGFPDSFILPAYDAQKWSHCRQRKSWGPREDVDSHCANNDDEDHGMRTFLKQQYRMLGNAVCPPIVAVLAGAILNHCLEDSFRKEESDNNYTHANNWLDFGREIAVRLAFEAVLEDRRQVVWDKFKEKEEEAIVHNTYCE